VVVDIVEVFFEDVVANFVFWGGVGAVVFLNEGGKF